MRCLTIVTWLAALACNTTPPSPLDYDATCAAPTDCEVVLVRGYCGGCDGLFALASSDAAAFNADQDAYVHPRCRSVILPLCDELDPADATADCVESRCAVAP